MVVDDCPRTKAFLLLHEPRIEDSTLLFVGDAEVEIVLVRVDIDKQMVEQPIQRVGPLCPALAKKWCS